VTTPAADPSPPAWVHKRDGRLVPFDADKISRSLFAATEALGRPDPFLARELTDGVVHFLSGEAEGAIPTTTQVADLVVKVIRELGHPALARAYADYSRPQPTRRPAKKSGVTLRFSPDAPPTAVVAGCLRAYTLQAVFTRDLVAAHDAGLLALAGLEAPGELAGAAVEWAGEDSLLERLLEARRHAAEYVALDGVEHVLARSGMGVETFVRQLAAGLRATGLRAVLNLNVAGPPPWADDLAGGPLFAGQPDRPPPERLAALADALLEALPCAPVARGRLRIDWHLAGRDLAAGERLLRAARLAAEDGPIAFALDRPRRPVALAEGIDRRHPAVLTAVGLHLPRLLELPGLNGDAGLFVQKLGSLARLALSAGAQKRDYLRCHAADRPALGRGFLLERARLVVVPVGLEAAVRSLTGRGLSDDKALDLARQALDRLRDVLSRDGRACLDGPADFALGAAGVAGLTGWDAAAPVRSQLRAAGALHAAAGGGTAAVLLPEGERPGAGQAAEWLRGAWRQTDAARLRLVRAGAAHAQGTLPALGTADS
jgi:hypothetical protein